MNTQSNLTAKLVTCLAGGCHVLRSARGAHRPLVTSKFCHQLALRITSTPSHTHIHIPYLRSLCLLQLCLALRTPIRLGARSPRLRVHVSVCAHGHLCWSLTSLSLSTIRPAYSLAYSSSYSHSIRVRVYSAYIYCACSI